MVDFPLFIFQNSHAQAQTIQLEAAKIMVNRPITRLLLRKFSASAGKRAGDSHAQPAPAFPTGTGFWNNPALLFKIASKYAADHNIYYGELLVRNLWKYLALSGKN